MSTKLDGEVTLIPTVRVVRPTPLQDQAPGRQAAQSVFRKAPPSEPLSSDRSIPSSTVATPIVDEDLLVGILSKQPWQTQPKSQEIVRGVQDSTPLYQRSQFEEGCPTGRDHDHRINFQDQILLNQKEILWQLDQIQAGKHNTQKVTHGMIAAGNMR